MKPMFLSRLYVIIAVLGLHVHVYAAGALAKHISVWTHSSVNTIEFAVINEAARAFNRTQHAYTVEIFPSSHKKYEERVRSAAGTGTLPCLLEIDGPFLSAFAWPGYLRPIDKFVPRELLNDLLPSIVAQGTYEGRLYSLGQFDSGLGLWANRRHLAAAGVRIPTVRAPWSLSEFEQAMDKLTALEGVEYALSLNFQFGHSEFYSYAYGPLLQGFGGDLIERGSYRSAKGVLDGPQSAAAIKRVRYWIERGWTQAVFDRADDFDNGKAALSWTGHWKYPVYRKALGKDLILLPLPDFGRGIKTGMGSWSWGITSSCREPAGTWAFLSYLMSTGEILRMTKANGAVPARLSALKQSPLYGKHGPLRIFVQQLNAGLGVPRPTTPAYAIISRAFSKAVSDILLGGDVQTELGKAAEIIDQDIATHRGYPVF